MGMDYVPVYEDETQGDSTVEGRAAVKVPPERAQLLGIRSVLVGSGFTGGSVRTVGRVAVDERRREVVHAKYEGYVETLLVDFTGKQVTKGEKLLTLYSPELVAAQKEYLVARAARARLGDSSVAGVARGGAELADAARQRLRSFDVGPEEIAELEETGTSRRTVTLRSPVSGVVVEKTAVEGMKVSPADRLYEIVDLSQVWILAEVYERDLGAVRVGLPARVTLATPPGGEWRGIVSFVSPTVKPDTRTVEARIDVDNAAGVLKPDMFVDVSLEGAPSAALTVPESAVIPTGERTLVFVDKGDGHYEPREVALGTRVAGAYECDAASPPASGWSSPRTSCSTRIQPPCGDRALHRRALTWSAPSSVSAQSTSSSCSPSPRWRSSTASTRCATSRWTRSPTSRHAGHRLLPLGPQSRHHRRPGHLPDRGRTAWHASRQGRTRLLRLRLFVCLRHLPGRTDLYWRAQPRASST